MSNDPWQDIALPTTVDAISAKRVDPDLRWNFFWGRALDRRCVFVLQHDPDNAPRGRLPNLRGVEITDMSRGDGQDHVLMFKLLEDGQRDIFQRLCRDIVSSTAVATTEAEAVALTLARTFRWHHLLRGGSDSRLSAEEQKGLIAELLILERHLLRCLQPQDAVNAWRGPLGAPKDFEIGRLGIEAKARRGAARPHVAISSADQLDTAGVDDLLLLVVDVDQVPAGEAGYTLTEMASRVREVIRATDLAAADAFDALLLAAGFDWADDYADMRWIDSSPRLFRISEDFPRISASALPSGIANVKYTIALQDCFPHAVDGDGIVDAVKARMDER